MNPFPQRFVTCPDCGDPNVPCDTTSQRCDLCSTVHHFERQQERKRRQLSDDPTIPAQVETNLMNALHVQHAHNIRNRTILTECGTCGCASGNDHQCVYCRNSRRNPNLRSWTPSLPPAAATFEPDLFPSDAVREAFRDLDPNGNFSRETPKKARLIDISGIADRELTCVICMEDIPADVERVYFCDCQLLICEACLTKPEVLRLEKCPTCRKYFKYF